MCKDIFTRFYIFFTEIYELIDYWCFESWHGNCNINNKKTNLKNLREVNDFGDA